MASKKTKFPRKMFQLTPSMNVREITLTGPAFSKGWNGQPGVQRYGYAVDEKGKQHYVAWLHDTKGDAVKAGEKTMAEQEARLVKAQTNVAKRRANLEKAKGAAA